MVFLVIILILSLLPSIDKELACLEVAVEN